jgi:transcription elongation factor GreB
MSKAFLRESDHDPEPTLAAPVSPLPTGARNYLTAAGAERLRDELRTLRLTTRPGLSAKAPRDGDAKARLAAVDHRIRYLQQSLLTAEIVDSKGGRPDAVRFGSTVIVRANDGSVARYRLVGVDETDPSRGDISYVSPLAQALMNARKGERVSVAAPGGSKTLTVLDIRFDE